MDANCDPPFFIVGVPRSGTTLLQRMLDSHPEIAVCPETNVFTVLERVLATQTIQTQWQYDAILDMLLHMLQGFLDPAHELVKDFKTQKPNYRGYTRDLLNQLAVQYMNIREKSRFGEKTPEHLLVLPTILNLYPAAKIILIVRHPLAASASLLNSYQLSPLTVKLSIPHLLFKVSVLLRRSARTAQAFQQQHPSHLHIVSYEDLVNEPKQVLTQICTFLGLEYHPDMLSFHQQPIIKPDNPTMLQIHKNLTKPVSNLPQHKYHDELSEVSQQWLSYFLRKQALYANYTYPKAGWKWPINYYLWMLITEVYFRLGAYNWKEAIRKSGSYLRLKAKR